MSEFDNWNILKQKIDENNTVPLFKEREIWWCAIGQNIGHEENGKNNNFERPVLVLRKFNNRLFWGIPITSKIKNNKHYFHFLFKNQKQCAMLTQLRLWDANRFLRKKGRIDENYFLEIRKSIINYLQ